jgi:hypothetical protein
VERRRRVSSGEDFGAAGVGLPERRRPRVRPAAAKVASDGVAGRVCGVFGPLIG